MNLQVPTSQQALFSDLRQLAAIAGITVPLTGNLTGWKAIASFIGGIAILAIEHYVGDPSTGTPTSTGGTIP